MRTQHGGNAKHGTTGMPARITTGRGTEGPENGRPDKNATGGNPIFSIALEWLYL